MSAEKVLEKLIPIIVVHSIVNSSKLQYINMASADKNYYRTYLQNETLNQH